MIPRESFDCIGFVAFCAFYAAKVEQLLLCL